MHGKSSHSEEEEHKEFDLKLFHKLWDFIKPYSSFFYLAIILMLIATVLGPLRPYLSKIAIDNYIMTRQSNGFFVILFIIFITLLLHSITQFGANYLMKWIGQKALFDLRYKLFTHIQGLDTSFFDQSPVGLLVTRVTNDIETISELLSGGFIMIIIDLILILAIIGFMLVLNVELTLFSLSVLPLLFILTIIFRKKIRKIFREIRLSVSKINSFLNEYISGIFTIKLYRKEDFFADKFQKLNDENKKLWIRTINYFALFFPTIEFVSSAALALIIWFTAKEILSGHITLGIFFAFIQYAEMFFRPIRDLTEKFTNLQNALASSERIFHLFDQKPKIVQVENPIRFISLKEGIDFRNVAFSYDGINPVISDVSFHVSKGETVAIVGHTGSGKTTLINLLTRFYEVEKGEILIDGIDLKLYDIESFRSRISIVSQEVFLFSREISQNISLGWDVITEEMVYNTLKKLGLETFITSLPDGIKTNVFEKGLNLSAGQKQLIAFARALVKNPEILILDEATSNIDSHYEKMIENISNQILQGRTSIVIAHRLSTVQKANRIVVLHKGKIAEIGTHIELLRKDGIYSKLYKLQFANKLNISK